MAQPKLHICDMQANDVADALKSWLAMKSGGSHRDNHHFQWVIAPKRTYRPTTHPIVLPPFHPTKSFACTAWAVFFFSGKLYLENFMSRPNVIPAFRPTPLQNRGRNFVRVKRRSTYTSSGTLYLFLCLNNSETIFGNTFWAQRWRARTVPWPQIFNSWKCCAPSGLHFFNASAFPKWSCWGVPAPNPAHIRTLRCERTACRAYIASPRS